MTETQIAEFRQTIYKNYAAAARSFAWRTTHDPYAILVSEMMLQQTQTVRVVPKYEEWLAAYPDCSSLAHAPLEDVLRHWSGLGYNRRAVYLQKACRAVCDTYGGSFPREPEKREQLPGIGPYTARAVSTFAFNIPNVFIETNIRSVYIFFFFKDSAEKVPDSRLIPFVQETMDRDNPREWYYALMDYGAELKKKTVNPSRKSASYVRQSRFEGSLRQARGAILRMLTKYGAQSLESIGRQEQIEPERLYKAAEGLEKESLICRTAEGVYKIIGSTRM